MASWVNALQSNTEYYVFNITGQLLKQDKLNAENVVNIEGLPNGTYFLKLGVKNNSVIKFVKQ